MSYWEGPARWINTILIVILGFIGFDTLFRLLEAREQNTIVGFVRSVSAVFLAPFQDMFDDQAYLMTAIIALLGYCLVAAIALAVVGSIQASRRPVVRETRVQMRPTRASRSGPADPAAAERTRRLDAPTAGEDVEATRRL